MKPRCGWRIDGLVPYRLLVALIENRRIDGKVRDGYQEVIDDDRKGIAAMQEQIELCRERMTTVQPVIADIGHNIRKVQQRLAEGDRSVIKESAEVRREAHMSYGYFKWEEPPE